MDRKKDKKAKLEEALRKNLRKRKIFQKKNKFKFEEKKFSIKSLLDADEAFMTSATNFVMPIVKVDKFTISNGKPGLNTLKFRNLFINAI